MLIFVQLTSIWMKAFSFRARIRRTSFLLVKNIWNNENHFAWYHLSYRDVLSLDRPKFYYTDWFRLISWVYLSIRQSVRQRAVIFDIIWWNLTHKCVLTNALENGSIWNTFSPICHITLILSEVVYLMVGHDLL